VGHTIKIKELREARGISQQQLADMVGTTNQQISHLENGKRKLTIEWLQRLARALGCSPFDLVQTGQGPAKLTVEEPKRMQMPAASTSFRDLPMLGWVGAETGEDGIPARLANQAIQYVDRPPNLIGVEDAFAVYVAGDAMAPKYEPQQILYVNPRQPALPGTYVLAEQVDGQVTPLKFIQFKGEQAVFYQYNPAGEVTLKKRQIKRLMRIVGSSEA
jgi:transcriptional regulator with XRE-family HTH domain